LKNIPFFNLIQDQITRVESLMRQQAQTYHPDVQAALEHLILSGGKRVRPAVTILTGQMLGADPQRLITLASAIELLHTATLVHDDLIDGALLRRGNPTLNAHWSAGATVLTGDFIFARAAELAAATESVAVMKLFSRTLTVIVNGEITQLFTSHCLANRKAYYERIYAKTASLFETSSTAASMISPVSPEITAMVGKYGYQIGMAFQIIDDILDFTATEATLGKPIGSDLRQGIVTLPAIYYAENHPTDASAQKLIDGACIEDEKTLSNLVNSIRNSEPIHQAHDEARRFVEEGITALEQLPPSPEHDALVEMAKYFVDREI